MWTDPMGTTDAAAILAVSQDSSEITKKTDKKPDSPDSKFQKESQQVVEQSGEKNVLNNYRSVTYNFTLAALKKNYLKDPEELRNSELDLVILRSGGKGTQGIKSDSVYQTDDLSRRARQEFASKDPRRLDLSSDEKSQPLRNFGQELLADFNEKSPGRFDMFIDNVEVDSLMTFTEESNTSLPTKIKFEIIEPYSVNGFIEALHVTALAAGYPNYLSASFVLKVEFKGYPDDADFADPVTIPKSVRYFPIGLTGIEVDITERGTRYRVDAVPYNERAFGQPNTVKKPIKMEGSSVKEILTNFVGNVTKQAIESWKDSNKTGNPNQVDTYEVKFPSWSETDGWKDTDNSIAGTKLVELYKDNALYKLADPASTGVPNAYKSNGAKQPTPEEQAKMPASIKYNPNKTVVQFGEGMNVHDVIAAVIRDSEYVRNILKDIKKHTDPYGMVDYFMIRIETINTDIINEVSKKPVQKFTYVVTPYKVHYSKIPNLADNVIDESELKKLSLREYNYIYTGQNIDVLNFKLNFNTLFFEAIPASMGNKDVPEAKTAAGNDNNVKVTQNSPDNQVASKMQVPLHPKKPEVTPVQAYSGNASQPLDDPYSVLARSMHNAIVNSKASMISGELEILGDPLYLTTGGLGNYNPKPSSRGQYSTGEANQNYGQLMITINFRNPIDILPLEQGGTMFFDSNRVPFSGVYMVTQVTHTFREGMFKQRLSVIRMPGQVLDYSVKPTDVSGTLETQPSPGDQQTSDSTRSLAFSQRLDSATAFEQLGRGLPSPGLPGAASNFTAATGGLGGAASSLMNKTPGLGNALKAGSAVIGKPLPTDFLSNIRLSSSGLAQAAQQNLGTAALLAVATNVITGNIPSKRAIGVVAGAVVGSAVADALKRPNIGSGIGEGAKVSIPNPLTTPSSFTANDIKFGANINSTMLPSGSVSDLVGTAKAIGTNAIDKVTAIGKDVGKMVGGIGDKISSLAKSPADPQALGASVGLDVSKLSGLSPNLTSKVLGQVKGLVANTPSDVNLPQAVNAGLVLDYIPSSKIANIPATAPHSTAPAPSVDTAYVKQVVAAGGVTALENLYGVNNISKLSNNIAPPGLLNEVQSSLPLGKLKQLSGISGSLNKVDLNSLKDKLGTAQSQISGLTGMPKIPDLNSLGSVATKFGSNTIGSSPLDKLVNKLNDPNAAPYTGNDPIIRTRLGLPPTDS